MMIIAGIAAAAAVCHGFIASFEFQWPIRLHHDELRAKARFIWCMKPGDSKFPSEPYDNIVPPGSLFPNMNFHAQNSP